TWDDLTRLAIETTGERIIFLSSLGSTETSPLARACRWDLDRPGHIGLPAPGVELKLVPNEGKLEARLRGPLITPGYWRQDDLTAAAFDEEGFYKLGDALKFVDPDDPPKGLLFDGRIAEDFKLSTGTWVSVGPLRARFIDHFAPYIRDVVFAGADRDDIAALVFPDIEACRRLAGLTADATPAQVVGHTAVLEKFAALLKTLAAESAGSSTRVARALLMAAPPSMDVGEMTDKGSINQRAVLGSRAALVDELYATPLSSNVIATGEAQ
ncbi:MAG: feruloyl-CoA synthase, partial [Pseudolabrys sp.]